MTKHEIVATCFEVEVAFRLADTAVADDFEAFLDTVMEEFDKLELEVDVAASISNYVAVFSLEVGAAASMERATEFISNVRTALHGAGCGTPNWPVVSAELRSAQPRMAPQHLVDA